MKNKIIHQWIQYLMGESNSTTLVKDFEIEDGMDYSSYLSYETHNFQSLSHIFDLNKEFSIDIIHELNIGSEKTICFIYIRNHLQKIVCKMNITLKKVDDRFFISSNNYYSQLVPKHVLVDGQVSELGLAVKAFYPVLDIKCVQTETLNFQPASNFDDDGFSSARFSLPQDSNPLLTFYLKMENNGKNILEKRKIFFDDIDFNLKPFTIENHQITLIDSCYPVHISLYGDKPFERAYPRSIKRPLDNIHKVIVTDSLDNDWVINLPNQAV